MLYLDSMVLAQVEIFLEVFLLGFVLSFVYDIYRAFRLQWRRVRGEWLFFGDIVFWILSTLACLWFLFTFRWGEVHLYTYAGLAAGSGFYFAVLSRLLLGFWRKIVRQFFFVLHKMTGWIISPLHKIASKIKSMHILTKLGRIFPNGGRKING